MLFCFVNYRVHFFFFLMVISRALKYGSLIICPILILNKLNDIFKPLQSLKIVTFIHTDASKAINAHVFECSFDVLLFLIYS